MAVIKGIRNGLIVGVFSILAFIVGLAAAIKLSSVVAEHLEGTVNISAKWLPFISFLLVFLVIALLINWTARLIQAGVELAMLGWVNRIGGIILYVIMYTLIYSVVLFYLEELNLISQSTLLESVTFLKIQPIGPFVINGIGNWIPWFKDMFNELKDFFESLSDKIPEKSAQVLQ